MTATEQARKLLEAAERARASEDCRTNDGSHLFPFMVKGAPYAGCEDCLALSQLEGGAPATLAVAITLAERVRANHLRDLDFSTAAGGPEEHEEDATAERYATWADECDDCKALAEWEELFPGAPRA